MTKNKRITINDIARLAGVSKSTASLVLNGRGKELRVAQGTRDRVLEIARQQHYQPSIHARALNSSRSHTLGLVVPEMTNHGFARFSHELETLCRDAGLQLLIACTAENASQETLAVNNLIQRQVDGLIVASSMLNDAQYQKINQQLPVVLFDRHLGDSSLPLVITASAEPTAMLIQAVMREGYDEIYFSADSRAFRPRATALPGFILACSVPGSRPNQNGLCTDTIMPAQATNCLRNSTRSLGACHRRCFVPPAGCRKACCAILADITC